MRIDDCIDDILRNFTMVVEIELEIVIIGELTNLGLMHAVGILFC